MNYEGNN